MGMTMRVFFVLAFAFCAFSGAALGQDNADIAYKDGFLVKTVKGIITDKRLDGISFLADGAGESIDIDWKNLRKVNGELATFYEKRIREDFAKRACPDCKGGKLINKCTRCDGQGRIIGKLMACHLCKGSGQSACAAPGCVKGQAPCTSPCLKRYEGEWKKGPYGKWWQTYSWVDKGGLKHTKQVLETSCGKIIKVREKDNLLIAVTTCRTCNGTTRLPCKRCRASGKGTCTLCKGSKQEPDPAYIKPCKLCVTGIIVCKRCGGGGLLGARTASRKTSPTSSAAATKPAQDPNAIYLKDGTVIKGKIVLRGKTSIMVKTESGSVRSIKRTAIKSMPN
jgi:hypothetical protein